MTRRPSRPHRGRQRSGLFWQDGDDNPLDRPCPHPPCRATAGRPCTVHGRPMLNYHPSRKDNPDD